MNTLTLLPPTFRNGPPLCAQTRLPAFETEDSLRHFYGSLGDGVTITRIGRCRTCNLLDAEISELAQMAGENWGHVYPKAPLDKQSIHR